MDLERLDGSGLLELDEALMVREEQNLQKHLQLVHQKLRECEERYRTDADLQVFTHLIILQYCLHTVLKITFSQISVLLFELLDIFPSPCCLDYTDLNLLS